MKARGFTLIELVIVLVLIGISAIFSTRFIADMAAGYVGTAERSQALAGARFAMERIKRELSLAYSPSVYVSDDKRCVSFVPVLASGKYNGQVKDGTAQFIIPLALTDEAIANIGDINLAVRADSVVNDDKWKGYPESPLPANVSQMNYSESEPDSLKFTENSFVSGNRFTLMEQGNRYILLQRHLVRFCLQDDSLWRSVNTESGWSEPVLMLSNVMSNSGFSVYNESSQLLVMWLSLQTRDGELVLPNQIPGATHDHFSLNMIKLRSVQQQDERLGLSPSLQESK